MQDCSPPLKEAGPTSGSMIKVERKMPCVREGCMKLKGMAFEELIKERWSEVKREAEEKRQINLRRIADMKSRTGINPLARFPREIWDMVLKELSPTDQANMWPVHDVFRDLLEKNRVRDILFPLIMCFKVPVLSSFVILHRKQITNLRLISKSFRDAVDQWFEDNLLGCMRSTSESHAVPNVKFEFKEDMTELTRFLTSTKGPRPTRFFLRSISVVFKAEDVNVFQEFFPVWKAYISEVLGRVGDQIWHFEFSLNQINRMSYWGLSITQIYLILLEWLQRMPNLKWLYLNIESSELYNHLGNVNIDNAIIQGEEVPKLNDLERVDLTYKFGAHIAYPIGNAVLMANSHVKYFNYKDIRMLDTFQPETIDHQRYLYHRITAPAVTSLALESIGLGNERHYFDLALLRGIPESNWKLKRLELWLKPIHKRGKIRFDLVAEWLEKFPTLEVVSLNIERLTIGPKLCFLRLPNLKEFALNINYGMTSFTAAHRHFFSLQFLLHCSKLEKLHWSNGHKDSGDIRHRMNLMCISRKKLAKSYFNSNCFDRRVCRDDQFKRELMSYDVIDGVIDYKGGAVDLRESIIWDVFPRLKDIQVEFSEFHRFDLKYRSHRYIYRDGELIREESW